MTEPEKIQYLKNVLRVAHADKLLTSEEEQHLEEIRAAIRATKSQLRKVVATAGDAPIDLTPLSRLSHRIQNLEDMIEVGLADGQLGDDEKRLLIDAAKRVGVTQEQVNLILAEAKTRRNHASGKCPSCGANIGDSVRFCPACGTMVQGVAEQAPKAVDLSVPDSGITITFAESTSGGFPDAFNLAKQQKTFQEARRGKKRWFAVTADPEHIKVLVEIAEKLRGLRHREVYVAGKKEEWDLVFGFASCYSDRANSYHPVEYCFGVDEGRFNVWGCKLSTSPWGSPSDWVAFGKFVDSKTFEFDHDRIKHEMTQRLERARFCPHLRRRFISAVLRRLP
ncbi:MAG: zinc-ribbon domain-containing protein, partial [Planctomycetota bacterium]